MHRFLSVIPIASLAWIQLLAGQAGSDNSSSKKLRQVEISNGVWCAAFYADRAHGVYVYLRNDSRMEIACFRYEWDYYLEGDKNLECNYQDPSTKAPVPSIHDWVFLRPGEAAIMLFTYRRMSIELKPEWSPRLMLKRRKRDRPSMPDSLASRGVRVVELPDSMKVQRYNILPSLARTSGTNSGSMSLSHICARMKRTLCSVTSQQSEYGRGTVLTTLIWDGDDTIMEEN